MNKVYGTLLVLGLITLGAFELGISFKDYERLDYETEEPLVEEDTAIMWFDEVMAKGNERKAQKDSVINELLERANSHRITRRDFEMAEKLMQQRESLAYQRGLHHDTAIIDTIIYNEVHVDTIVYDTHYVEVVDTVHRDTVVYDEKKTGWKIKKRKKKGNGWRN